VLAPGTTSPARAADAVQMQLLDGPMRDLGDDVFVPARGAE
jgi:hypothetical protein